MIKKNPILAFFASVKLAVVLLVLISVVSVVGTLIPQQEASGPLIARLSPGVANLMRSLQFFDIFHSFWFIALMFLLAVNLAVCSLDRFPLTWKRFRRADEIRAEDLSEKNLSDHVVIREAPLAGEADRIEKLLRKKTGRVVRTDKPDRSSLRMQKGAYSYFGVYVIHASVLIILAGVMMRLLFGFEGFVNIPEGETVSAVTIKGDGRMMKLDFAVRCDRFFIDFYENGAPKTYRSDLAFLKDGKAVQSSTLLVNHPVVFGGMRFYQAHYGKISGDDPVLSVMRNGNKIKDVKAAIGMTFDLPDHKATVQMVRVEEDLMGMGPAVKLNIRSSGGNVQFWVFEAIAQIAQANPGLLEQIPVFNPGLFKPYVFSLVQADHRYYTGLQVARDPGIPVVAAGALVMLIGFMIVFFSSHRQIRIRLDSLGDKTKISISGWSNRDAVGLDREIRYWIRAAGTDKEPRA